MRSARKFAVLLVAAALWVGHAAPASAATGYAYTLGNNPPGEGTIQVSASITFQSAKSFTYSVYVRDYCGPTGQGDGYGAASRFGLNTSGISYVTEWKKNQDGCGTTKHFTGTVAKTVNIVNVYGFLGRTNGDVVTAVAQSSCMDNPFVAGSTC